MANIKLSKDGKILLKAEGVKGHFVIPEGVTEIGKWAFEDCTGLTSIEIPSSVTKIGESAFWGCTGLTSIKFPDSVTEFPDNLFWGCKNLRSIELPSTLQKIALKAFEGCDSLEKLHCRSTDPDPDPEKASWLIFKVFDEQRNDWMPLPFMQNCKLYVPQGTARAYREHPAFGQFETIEEE